MSTQSQILTLPQGQFTPLQDVTVQGLVASGINIILIVASVLFVFSFLLGGVKMIISAGAKEAMDNARRQLVNSLIGVFIVFSSWAGLGLVSQFFGIDLLSFQIPTL